MTREEKIQKISKTANQVVMNEKEQEAQRRSFAFGNAKIENEFVTKEMIDKVAKELTSDPQAKRQ